MKDNVEVICCFCGNALGISQAVEITIQPPKAKDETQNLFCHKKCLNKVLIKNIPLHPDLNSES
jgi:hypothetical protein